MLRLTLDTSSVIDVAQAQPRGPLILELVDLAREGRAGLWTTEAFTVDQETAPLDKSQINLAWLSQQPVIGRVPGPFRLGYSELGGPDFLTDDDNIAAADAVLCEILLADRFQAERLDEDDAPFMAKWRKKVTDIHHLTGHLMAGHDAFVTSDHDDLLKNQAELRARTGIVVVNPAEAVQLAHRHPGPPRSTPAPLRHSWHGT
jgi:hypothetical protein